MEKIFILRYSGYSDEFNYGPENPQEIMKLLRLPKIIESNIVDNFYFIMNDKIHSKYHLKISDKHCEGSVVFYKRDFSNNIIGVSEGDVNYLLNNFIVHK